MHFLKNGSCAVFRREGQIMRTRSRERMNQIESFVDEYTLEYRHSPSIQTIADKIGVSKSTAFYYLRDMTALGILEYDDP